MSTSRIAEGDGDPRHGTTNGYTNLKCRCKECRAAWAQRRQAGILAMPDHLARLEAIRLPCGTPAAYRRHHRERRSRLRLVQSGRG